MIDVESKLKNYAWTLPCLLKIIWKQIFKLTPKRMQEMI